MVVEKDFSCSAGRQAGRQGQMRELTPKQMDASSIPFPVFRALSLWISRSCAPKTLPSIVTCARSCVCSGKNMKKEQANYPPSLPFPSESAVQATNSKGEPSFLLSRRELPIATPSLQSKSHSLIHSPATCPSSSSPSKAQLQLRRRCPSPSARRAGASPPGAHPVAVAVAVDGHGRDAVCAPVQAGQRGSGCGGRLVALRLALRLRGR